uniref:Uncharacterized protein n=1 Tax=Arundo donax TaxID=35708 RepID=A0A0A9BE88_ARUDO
METRRGFE